MTCSSLLGLEWETRPRNRRRNLRAFPKSDQPGLFTGVIAFYGEGFKLTCESSPLLDALKTAGEERARLVICRTCLDNYGIRDQVRVGIIGGMGKLCTR
jgi:hypothetical protein